MRIDANDINDNMNDTIDTNDRNDAYNVNPKCHTTITTTGAGGA